MAGPSSGLSQLIAAAVAPYRTAGSFAWHFARGKLRYDPIFSAILERGLLPPQGRILDLGCGQGLLAAWLLAAQSCHTTGEWPAGWPPPPHPVSIHGIELMPREIWRARKALAGRAEFVQGDIAQCDFSTTDVAVIFDVLHYLGFKVQEQVLRRVRTALEPQGRLLLRIGDAAGGWRFALSYWMDLAVVAARGHCLRRLYCRPLARWIELLESLGFIVQTLPMNQGVPFANVLLVGRLKPRHQ